MKWLTIPQIKRRSKTYKGALKVSYEHWNQLYMATAKELRAAYWKKLFVDDRDCGLCLYNIEHFGSHSTKRCVQCPLVSCGAGSLYDIAKRELDKWYDNYDGDWHTWKRTCKALRDKLKELMEYEEIGKLRQQRDDLLKACEAIVVFCEEKERLEIDGICPTKAYELSKVAIAKTKQE